MFATYSMLIAGILQEIILQHILSDFSLSKIMEAFWNELKPLYFKCSKVQLNLYA
jgi:hypothetical protein